MFLSTGEYNSTPSLPAYKNDFRFDPIDFKWIHNTQVKKQVPKESNYCMEDQSQLNATKINNTSDPYLLLKHGVLKRQDIYCLKAVAEYTTCNFVLWLTNFLLLKDLQSKYSFVNSCLVTR